MKELIFFGLFLSIASANRTEQSRKLNDSLLNEYEGLREEVPFIVGGKDAEEGEFPWQVSLQKSVATRTYHFCGGSIIDETHILTAAHCTDGQNPASISVVAGAHNVKDRNEAGQQRVKVLRLIKNPSYSSRRISYDASIIVLAEPIVFNDKVKAIRLAPKGHEPSGKCVNSGWGNANRLGLRVPVVIPNALQKVNMTIVSRGICRVPYFFVNWVSKSMICGDAGNLKGSCNGDSGGPLICYDLPNDPEPYLAGIVSWGMSVCAQRLWPTVFGHVGGMRDFIDEELVLEKKCTYLNTLNAF